MSSITIDRVWIRRKLADRLFDRIMREDGTLAVYFIEASAGVGKTFLARDVGTRLGSPTGYEPSRNGTLIWLGILDVYDPDTKSSSGIERRIMDALIESGVDAGVFDDYNDARGEFEAGRRTGYIGSSLEEQRKKMTDAFADALRSVSRKWRIVLVYDTVERLERATDPTQQALEYYDDTALLAARLIRQITRLAGGVVLLLGRHAPSFRAALHAEVQRANREERSDSPIEYTLEKLPNLDAGEQQDFFEHRRRQHSELHKLLSRDLEGLMCRTVGGNPLLLDLALQTLLQTRNPEQVTSQLHGQRGIEKLERILIAAFQNSANPARQMLLHLLAVARNGLFADLVQALNPTLGADLCAELELMGDLPFVKVRDLPWPGPGSAGHGKRRVYFLHDAMYTVYDLLVLRPEEVQDESKRIVRAYERWLDEVRMQLGKARTDKERDVLRSALEDLQVESLFYRLRADPRRGYQWYLKQTDRAIRNYEIGYDMRLRNELVLFLVSAGIGDPAEAGESLRSPIDQANLEAQFPQLVDHFFIDSSSSWIKRFSIRGDMVHAGEFGEKMRSEVQQLFDRDPNSFRLAFAEFLLWFAQVTMYGMNNQEAYTRYRNIIDDVLEDHAVQVDAELTDPEQKFAAWRLTMVLGRTYNNLGYLNWMYLGRYQLAIAEFQRARALFLRADKQDPSIREELANASDNLGRVYAQIGKQFQPQRLIRNGLEIREEVGSVYRTALSQVSLAHSLLRLGDYTQGFQAAEKAMVIFKRIGAKRGVGLSYLVNGMILRNRAESWRERGVPAQNALEDIDSAENYLREAVTIFAGAVTEPIRSVQAHNELGCCYRARYLILHKSGGSTNDQEFALTQARIQFREAIKIAEVNQYNVELLDTMQDLAVMFDRSGQYEEARKQLKQIAQVIADHSPDYIIAKQVGLRPVSTEDRIDAYYKLMGQVELLLGAIDYECARREPGSEITSDDLPTDDAIIATSQHYLFAVTYFHEFGEEDLALRQTYERMYKRFQYCRPELMARITQELIPDWIKDYNLPEDLVRGLFEDLFPLLD